MAVVGQGLDREGRCGGLVDSDQQCRKDRVSRWSWSTAQNGRFSFLGRPAPRFSSGSLRLAHPTLKLTSVVAQPLLAPLALAAAAPQVNKITYDGYMVFRISTHHDAAIVKEQLKPLTAVPFNLNDEEHLDVAIAPQDLDAFAALELESQVLQEDLGADIREEAHYAAYDGVSAQAVPSLVWFN